MIKFFSGMFQNQVFQFHKDSLITWFLQIQILKQLLRTCYQKDALNKWTKINWFKTKQTLISIVNLPLLVQAIMIWLIKRISLETQIKAQEISNWTVTCKDTTTTMATCLRWKILISILAVKMESLIVLHKKLI